MTLKHSFGEIFEQTKKLSKQADKMKWLQDHACLQLYYFLWVALGGQVEWLIAEGKPDIKQRKHRSAVANRRGEAPVELYYELRRLYLFLKGTGDALPAPKRDRLFADILESLAPSEQDLLVAVKDGTFGKDYGVTKALVEKTFPGLFDAPFQNRFIQRR